MGAFRLPHKQSEESQHGKSLRTLGSPGAPEEEAKIPELPKEPAQWLVGWLRTLKAIEAKHVQLQHRSHRVNIGLRLPKRLRAVMLPAQQLGSSATLHT